MENGILSHWKTEPLTHMWLCCPLNGLFSLFMGKVLFLQWKDFWFHIVSTFKDHYSCQANPRWLGLTCLMNSEDNLLTELKQKLFMQIPQQLIEKESASKLLKTALCVWGFLPGWGECSVTRWCSDCTALGMTKCPWIVYFEMVNFILCVFYHNKKIDIEIFHIYLK